MVLVILVNQSYFHCVRLRTQQIPDLVVLIVLQIVAVGVAQTVMLDVVVPTSMALLVCGCHKANPITYFVGNGCETMSKILTLKNVFGQSLEVYMVNLPTRKKMEHMLMQVLHLLHPVWQEIT